MAPTHFPSSVPTTSLPTALPSITGAVAVVEVQKVVTSSLDEEELAVIVASIVDAYGVDEEELQIEVVYETTGSIVLGELGDVSEEEVLATLEDELAVLLGVHESEISVTLEDGVVYYTISSSSVEAAEAAQSVLDAESAAEQLSIGLENLEVLVASVNVDEEIVADVVVTVDTSNASNNLSEAAETLGSTLEASGFTASVQSKRSCSGKCLCLRCVHYVSSNGFAVGSSINTTNDKCSIRSSHDYWSHCLNLNVRCCDGWFHRKRSCRPPCRPRLCI